MCFVKVILCLLNLRCMSPGQVFCFTVFPSPHVKIDNLCYRKSINRLVFTTLLKFALNGFISIQENEINFT